MATMRQLSVWTRSCEVSVAAAVYDCLGEQASGLWSIGNASTKLLGEKAKYREDGTKDGNGDWVSRQQ